MALDPLHTLRSDKASGNDDIVLLSIIISLRLMLAKFGSFCEWKHPSIKYYKTKVVVFGMDLRNIDRHPLDQ